MKITHKPDRIRLQAENAAESEAVRAIHDLIFHGDFPASLANDHGCRKFPDGEHYNYCSIPPAMSVEQSQGLCAASNQEN
jgi:hypothetical protein